MDATVWSDVICPWCYAGLDRTAHLRELGVTVTVAPFELHPEFTPRGVSMSDGRRWDGVRSACEQAGLPFRVPPRVPNTRRLLEAAEVLRSMSVPSHDRFHDLLLTAAFGAGTDLGDPDVVDHLMVAAGGDPAEVWEAVDSGAAAPAVDLWREAAFEVGAGATPAWYLDSRYLIPGVQPRDTFTRAVDRLVARPRKTTAASD
ncbi:MAG: DsbA family oxidoreductase [Acidimicrobiales bacterium]